MMRITGTLAIGLGAFLVATSSAQAPVRDKAVAVAGTGTLSGRVTEASSGEPVRKAQVRVVDTTVLPKGRVTLTDVNGRYTLTALPAGHYTVSVGKSTYIAAVYGQASSFDEATPVALPEGQTIDRIDLQLSHAGVVSGRVTDESGEPISRVNVSVMRRRFLEDGQPHWTHVAQRSTNDLGEFRIFGLAPGRYVLSAASAFHYHDGNDSSPQPYIPTYFPGTTNAAQAQLLSIAKGQVASNLNFALLSARAVRVSGTAVDSSGRPFSGSVRLSGPETSITATIAPDGAFSFASVPPEDYVLQTNGREAQAQEHAAMRLTVGESDLSDVALIGAARASLSGRVMVDKAATTTIEPGAFALLLHATRPDQQSIRFLKVNDDFAFQIDDWPAHIVFGVKANANASGWILKQARLKGQDITEDGVEFGAGSLAGLEVEITNVTSEVSGTVHDANGKPTRHAWVLLFPQDRRKWRMATTASNPNIIAIRPGATLRYRAPSLRPGAYYAVAVGVEAIDADDWYDTDLLDRLRPHAIAIDAVAGSRSTVDLVLTTLEP